ncbi:MAG: class I SAM-dependent rRNA methyltransferase, partial [Bacteroidota bacterium]|nr:class I SAM-dependent rRNA methyltransferase [Bacteroidota bacterium]
MVNSEGDGLPGLIIDWYNGVAVIQSQSPGMLKLNELFSDILREIFGEKLIAVYDKETGEFLYGNSEPALIKESGHLFRVDFVRGQKTGFFLDQRRNRRLAGEYAQNRNVLNLFCYSGAFSVYALKGGATSVYSVDSSRQAIGWTKENIILNGIEPSRHHSDVADVKQFLPGLKEKYDMIILDPPGFAKTHTVTHNALQAYIRINAEAMKHLNPGGILFTFSCSQPISSEMFRSAIMSAALESGIDLKVLHRLSQGPDHPVNLYHPEGEYLKGLVVIKI